MRTVAALVSSMVILIGVGCGDAATSGTEGAGGSGSGGSMKWVATIESTSVSSSPLACNDRSLVSRSLKVRVLSCWIKTEHRSH